MAGTINDDHHRTEVQASSGNYTPYLSASGPRRGGGQRLTPPGKQAPREQAAAPCRYSALLSGHASPSEVRAAVGRY
jgi:hypothetical protein